MARASDSKSEGWGFESLLACHLLGAESIGKDQGPGALRLTNYDRGLNYKTLFENLIFVVCSMKIYGYYKREVPRCLER